MEDAIDRFWVTARMYSPRAVRRRTSAMPATTSRLKMMMATRL